MSFTPVKTPLFVEKIFPNYHWKIKTDSKELFLTFDDGPTPEVTQWTLEMLEKYNAKATFFCIGKNVESYPNIYKSILNKGHTVGNHTYNHLKGWKISHDDYIIDTNKASTYIKSALFRPPYGKLTPKQGKTLISKGYKIIMWDVLSIDWDNTISKETCLENVISKSKPGSIIVFHDSLKAAKNMKYTLPKVLDHFSDAGYNFRALNLDVFLNNSN